MADKKISELTTLLAADVATNDVLPIVDSSATETKKITIADAKEVFKTTAINVNSATDAFKITQTGTGNAFVVEDSVSPDSSSFIIDNAGRISIGSNSSGQTDTFINVTGSIPSSSIGAYGLSISLTIPSTTTGASQFISTNSSTPATTFTLGTLRHYSASQGTFGLGSIVTNQYGFVVQSSLTGATNNYGFYSDIASSANRWNFFANGTANNAFAGNTRFGGVTAPTVAVDVTGDIKATGNIAGGYASLAAGTTAMAFGSDNVVRVTPNATATYTTTVPAAGAICVLSILTSGTVSYTITFGTGFKSTGTLATGTVSARYFNLTFVSDGTNLIETARTVAIA